MLISILLNIGHLKHRTNLLNNPNRYICDKGRAIDQYANKSYIYYGPCGKNRKIIIPLLKKLGELVFQNQDCKPMF